MILSLTVMNCGDAPVEVAVRIEGGDSVFLETAMTKDKVIDKFVPRSAVL